ncbi:MAG TPA: Gfo/Idh/MocA family oxidoreductase [Ilumatobacteraceae bacterium]|nr:Gfo/Idh/MocA family oxidoreductase [Ilumatobacteraceae bacterium]
MSVRMGVNGLDHNHVFEIVDRLAKAGAAAACHVQDGGFLEAYEGWQTESRPVTFDEMLADDTIDLVVTAAIPNRRADIALAAIAAGKHVVTDKPGLTTMAQLDALRAAVAGRPGRPWTVLFTERYENRAIAEAVRLARSGAVGRIVHVIGAGPHTMWAKRRPDWFWDPEATGGILVDIGSHQVDQFLAITDMTAADVAVVAAAVGNVASPEHPSMQDIGSMTLCGLSGSGPERPGRSVGVGSGKTGVVSDHRLDYLTAKGLGTWGDCRLTIVGVEGTIEARANVDIAGVEGAEHLIVVDGDGTRRVDISGVVVDWGEQLIADLADGGERLMTQQHAIDVTDVCLRAQAAATPWGHPLR